MPAGNQFQHQSYPTIPNVAPVFRRLKVVEAVDGSFTNLHRQHQISRLILVHGTFMGDDPFAVAEVMTNLTQGIRVLEKPVKVLTTKLRENGLKITRTLTKDIANYHQESVNHLQRLVGDDPQVSLLSPTWSSQNHHVARADLAVRLVNCIAESNPSEQRRLMLWGHSHAGQGFAILTNLLANHRATVEKFFRASQQTSDHWQQARDYLRTRSTPVKEAQWLDLCTFGTPVRYGWDPQGCANLLHISHHRPSTDNQQWTTHSLFPPHAFSEMVSAKYGDWVQAFGIAGTDVVPPGLSEHHQALGAILEQGLQTPEHDLSTRFLPTQRIRNTCARWKTGTRCHTDGLNILTTYQPSGRKTHLAVPIENSVFGHGVYTTSNWLAAHLKLVLEYLTHQ